MTTKTANCERGVATIEMCIVGWFLSLFAIGIVGLFIDFMQTCKAIIDLQELPEPTRGTSPVEETRSFTSIVPFLGSMEVKKHKPSQSY